MLLVKDTVGSVRLIDVKIAFIRFCEKTTELRVGLELLLNRMESADVNSKGYYVASKMQYTPYGVCLYGYRSTNKRLNAYARSSTLQFYPLLTVKDCYNHSTELVFLSLLIVKDNRQNTLIPKKLKV